MASKEDDEYEATKQLRRLEMESYGATLSAFRAQGELTAEKRRLLSEMARMLHIDAGRHRSEVRRVVNEERLGRICKILTGKPPSADWLMECRRVVPVASRRLYPVAFHNAGNAHGVPLTAFKDRADDVAAAWKKRPRKISPDRPVGAPVSDASEMNAPPAFSASSASSAAAPLDFSSESSGAEISQHQLFNGPHPRPHKLVAPISNGVLRSPRTSASTRVIPAIAPRPEPLAPPPPPPQLSPSRRISNSYVQKTRSFLKPSPIAAPDGSPSKTPRANILSKPLPSTHTDKNNKANTALHAIRDLYRCASSVDQTGKVVEGTATPTTDNKDVAGAVAIVGHSVVEERRSSVDLSSVKTPEVPLRLASLELPAVAASNHWKQESILPRQSPIGPLQSPMVQQQSAVAHQLSAATAQPAGLVSTPRVAETAVGVSLYLQSPVHSSVVTAKNDVQGKGLEMSIPSPETQDGNLNSISSSSLPLGANIVAQELDQKQLLAQLNDLKDRLNKRSSRAGASGRVAKMHHHGPSMLQLGSQHSASDQRQLHRREQQPQHLNNNADASGSSTPAFFSQRRTAVQFSGQTTGKIPGQLNVTMPSQEIFFVPPQGILDDQGKKQNSLETLEPKQSCPIPRGIQQPRQIIMGTECTSTDLLFSQGGTPPLAVPTSAVGSANVLRLTSSPAAHPYGSVLAASNAAHFSSTPTAFVTPPLRLAAPPLLFPAFTSPDPRSVAARSATSSADKTPPPNAIRRFLAPQTKSPTEGPSSFRTFGHQTRIPAPPPPPPPPPLLPSISADHAVVLSSPSSSSSTSRLSRLSDSSVTDSWCAAAAAAAAANADPETEASIVPSASTSAASNHHHQQQQQHPPQQPDSKLINIVGPDGKKYCIRLGLEELERRRRSSSTGAVSASSTSSQSTEAAEAETNQDAEKKKVSDNATKASTPALTETPRVSPIGVERRTESWTTPETSLAAAGRPPPPPPPPPPVDIFSSALASAEIDLDEFRPNEIEEGEILDFGQFDAAMETPAIMTAVAASPIDAAEQRRTPEAAESATTATKSVAARHENVGLKTTRVTNVSSVPTLNAVSILPSPSTTTLSVTVSEINKATATTLPSCSRIGLSGGEKTAETGVITSSIKSVAVIPQQSRTSLNLTSSLPKTGTSSVVVNSVAIATPIASPRESPIRPSLAPKLVSVATTVANSKSAQPTVKPIAAQVAPRIAAPITLPVAQSIVQSSTRSSIPSAGVESRDLTLLPSSKHPVTIRDNFAYRTMTTTTTTILSRQSVSDLKSTTVTSSSVVSSPSPKTGCIELAVIKDARVENGFVLQSETKSIPLGNTVAYEESEEETTTTTTKSGNVEEDARELSTETSNISWKSRRVEDLLKRENGTLEDMTIEGNSARSGGPKPGLVASKNPSVLIERSATMDGFPFVPSMSKQNGGAVAPELAKDMDRVKEAFSKFQDQLRPKASTIDSRISSTMTQATTKCKNRDSETLTLLPVAKRLSSLPSSVKNLTGLPLSLPPGNAKKLSSVPLSFNCVPDERDAASPNTVNAKCRKRRLTPPVAPPVPALIPVRGPLVKSCVHETKRATKETRHHGVGNLNGDIGKKRPAVGETIDLTSDAEQSDDSSGDVGAVTPGAVGGGDMAPPNKNVPSYNHVPSWVRGTMSLLQKVSKFRGNKSKGEPDASAWFLAPVDPVEVPGYREVIEKPMDFGTIRHKLEEGAYESLDAFHRDMMLVKSNCERFNPSDHPVYKDCSQVFAFYLDEYNKLLDKWQKSHLLSTPQSVKKKSA